LFLPLKSVLIQITSNKQAREEGGRRERERERAQREAERERVREKHFQSAIHPTVLLFNVD
jgi:hypothetical protein